MSKFDLRDIADRLSGSRDTEAVVFEFLGYLQSLRPHWRASLAFYEVSTDSLVSLYLRSGMGLKRTPIHLPVDQLPPRLVRKFFHPSAFFNEPSRRSLLSLIFQSSPYYEPDPTEAPSLAKLSPIPVWQSCVCLPLADREDMMALVMLASEKKAAIPSKLIAQVLPAKSMAALALAQHLHRAQEGEPAGDRSQARQAATEFQQHILKLNQRAEALDESNREKEERLVELTREIEHLDKHSSEYRKELERVKNQLGALEDQAAAATDQLSQAYTELTATQERLNETQRTVDFVKEVFQVLSQEHESDEFAQVMVSWFCERFGVERCSLMIPDASQETLRIWAQRGIDPSVAAKVKVRIGQGVAGWVAHNRKPLLVQCRDQHEAVSHTDQDHYNSDSFICVPIVHRNQLCGVLNLSNKRDGEPFTELDLERAQLAGGVLGTALEQRNSRRRSEAWAA